MHFLFWYFSKWCFSFEAWNVLFAVQLSRLIEFFAPANWPQIVSVEKSASCVPNTFPRNCHNRIRPTQRFPEVPWSVSLKTGKVKCTKPREDDDSALPYSISIQVSALLIIWHYYWTLYFHRLDTRMNSWINGWMVNVNLVWWRWCQLGMLKMMTRSMWDQWRSNQR